MNVKVEKSEKPALKGQQLLQSLTDRHENRTADRSICVERPKINAILITVFVFELLNDKVEKRKKKRH